MDRSKKTLIADLNEERGRDGAERARRSKAATSGFPRSQFGIPDGAKPRMPKRSDLKPYVRQPLPGVIDRMEAIGLRTEEHAALDEVTPCGPKRLPHLGQS